MNKRLVPYLTARSIYDIDPAFYKELGVTVILSDLDNTLDPHYVKSPSPAAIALKEALSQEGVSLYIASNNTSKRVRHYAEALGVKCASGLLKPFSHRLRKFIVREGLKPEEILMIGDQIFTDVASANGAGVRAILTEPLGKKDPWTTWFNRLLEKPFRRAIKNKHLATDWRAKT